MRVSFSRDRDGWILGLFIQVGRSDSPAEAICFERMATQGKLFKFQFIEQSRATTYYEMVPIDDQKNVSGS